MAGGLAERAIDAAIMLAMPWRPRRGAVLMQAERHIGAEQGAERAERCDGVRLGGTGHRARRRRRAELQDKGEDRGPGEEGRANPAARAAARSSRRSLAASRHARSQMSQRAGRLVDQRGSVKRRRCRGRGSRTALPSPCSPSSLGECEAFVRATRFTGGSAGLDGSARRWPLAYHVLLVNDRGRLAAPHTKRTWWPLCRTDETQSSRRDAQHRRLGPKRQRRTGEAG
jgi:hypothetical protein